MYDRSGLKPGDPDVQEIKMSDIFSTENCINANLAEQQKVFMMKKFGAKSGSMAYLRRDCDNEALRNTFIFKVEKLTEKGDIWFGVERQEPTPFTWLYKLTSGQKSEQVQGASHYTTAKPQPGSVVKMILQGTQLRFMLDGKDLGICFKTDRLRVPSIKPFVYLQGGAEKVRVVNGSVHKIKQYGRK